ncbi:MAG: DUF1552 domain-containing protein [Bdellovibrionota bacterium]|nr:MAG: DUF1552 domain-containing protein [Pseudomonadota bacterium]
MDGKHKIKAEISRRNLIRYLGNGAIALPFMRTLLETEAFGAVDRKCMVIFYYPNGTKSGRFHPDQTGKSFSLANKEITAPLEAVRDHLLIPKNFNYGLASGSHEHGMNYFLTGTDALQNGYSSGVSIDTVLGERTRSEGALPVVRLGSASSEGGSNTMVRQEYASFSAPGQKAEILEDPIKAFNTLFGTTIPPSDGGAVGVNYAKSVLDASLNELKQLQMRLGQIEREKLQGHIEAVRSLEMTLRSPTNGTVGEQCMSKISRTTPFTGGTVPVHAQANYGEIVDLNIELAIQALACGRTNVVYIQNSRSVSGRLFNDQGLPGTGFNHHSDSHDKEFGGDIARYYKSQNWYMGRLAKLIGGLRDVKSGDKTLLYQSLVMATTEFGDCQGHDMRNIGMILAGQAGGYFPTGTCLDLKGYNHNQLLVTILQAFGGKDTTFGNAALGQGPIPALKA